MDPPSPQLVRRLASLGLCTPRDLNKCRRRVKHLASDLPTFDSVWVDALVQARHLTPFQAHWLESNDPERLSAGPCVLVDRIGSDGRFTHYRGRLRATRQPVTVTITNRELDAPTAALDRLREAIQGMRDFSHAGLLIASGCGPSETGIIVVSPWLESIPVHDLLVRRGRFAADVVVGIGQQLTEALATIEQRGGVHGDIRVRNVRLTSRGQSVLVNTALVPALWPELTIHADLPPDCFDAIAPELIGTGTTMNVRTDLYALGCVLWELLAGRPPFPHGDPLTRLAAHQALTVPDVRTWAPDTPTELANLITTLTARDAAQRPQSFHEVRLRLGTGVRGARRRLGAFHASFNRPATMPHAERGRALMRRTAATAGLLLLTVISVGLLNTGTRNELLSVAASGPGGLRDRVAGLMEPSEPQPADNPTATRETPSRLPFPTRIDHGVLTLDQPGPYAAGEIAASGPLRIRGAPGVRPVVLIDDKPLRIWAEQLILEEIEIRRDDAGHAPSVPLAVIEAQSLGVRRCIFASPDTGRSTALTWSPLDDVSSAPKRVLLTESLFFGSGTAIETRKTPGSVEMENVLKSGPGPLLELSAAGAAQRMTAVALRHVTLRNAGGVVRLTAGTGAAPLAALTLEDCILDVPAPSGALIEIAGTLPPPGWQQRIRITGENSLVRPETMIAALVPLPGGPVRELPADRLSIDGLLSSEITFSGAETSDPRDSAVGSQLGHGRSIQPPGIDPRVFAEDNGPYNSAALRIPFEPSRSHTP